jgi:hypothetical protein
MQPNEADASTVSAPLRRTLFAALMWPLLAFGVGRVFLMLAVSAWGFNPLDYRTWERGDSGLYLDIAVNGFNLWQSDGSVYPRGQWMGNCGWMPLYPWTVRVLSMAGFNIHAAAALLALLFHLLTLILLWNFFLTDVDFRRAFCCLLLAAFFPGQIYQFAAFPMSMFAFLILIAFRGVVRSQWWASALGGFAAAITYSTGFLLSIVLGLFSILSLSPRIPRRKDLLSRMVPIAAPLAGLASVLVFQRLTVGRWNAFFLVQSKYGHGLHDPAGTLLWQIRFFSGTPNLWPVVPQLICVALLVLGTCCWVAATWHRRPILDRLLAVFAVVFWVFTLVMGPEFFLRPAATLLPMSCLFRQLPVPFQIAMILIFAAVSAMAVGPFLTVPTI